MSTDIRESKPRNIPDVGLAEPADGRANLRDEQIELTRRRILDAVVRILAENVADLSVEAVARESGVSRPTIYRHFRTKRDMVDAVGRLYADRIGTSDAASATTLDELLEHVPGIFARYEQLEPELRAAAMSSQTRDAAVRYRADRLQFSRRMIDSHVDGLPAADRERLAQITTLLMSSATLRSIQHYLDLSPEEAGELVVWTIRRLVGERKGGST